jgi:hypothetical protein
MIEADLTCEGGYGALHCRRLVRLLVVDDREDG